jgi:integrase
MGTIVPRKRKNGTTAFLAKVSIMRDGELHRENKTFDRKPAATAWIAKREGELSKPGAISKIKTGGKTLADAIDRYILESTAPLGKTKTQVLEAIKRYDIAGMKCEAISSSELSDFARELSSGRTPATVTNYMSHLSAVFAIASPAWGYELNYNAMRDAQKVLKKLGIMGKAEERERRPTLDELDALLNHFTEMNKRRPEAIPMPQIIAFAIFSTRRQEEICTIKLSDFEEDESRVLVRNMKHPGQKIGNDVWCELTPEAVRIIKSVDYGQDRIFPFNHKSVSSSFTRACSFLDIDDLRFHDLRHDGVSRLFEMGRTIPQAASVSGHRSWQSLQRYTHMRKKGDKYEGWKWLDILTKNPGD